MEYKNLDQTKAYAKLAALRPPRVAELLNPQRVAACDVPAGGSLVYNWAATPVDEAVL